METLAWQYSLAAARLHVWGPSRMFQTFNMMNIMQSCFLHSWLLPTADGHGHCAARRLSTNLLIWGTTDQLTTAITLHENEYVLDCAKPGHSALSPMHVPLFTASVVVVVIIIVITLLPAKVCKRLDVAHL
jgi:hypothetical protein